MLMTLLLQLHGRLLSLVRVTESLPLPSEASTEGAWRPSDKACEGQLTEDDSVVLALTTLDQAAPICLSRSFAVQQAFCKLCVAVLSHNSSGYISLPSVKQLLESILFNQVKLKSRAGAFTSMPDGAILLMQLSNDSSSVCSALLREGMPPAVHTRALRECSQQPSLRKPAHLSSRVQQLVASDSATLDVKLQALLALDGSVQLSTIPGLAARCLSAPEGPLRESLMPLAASQLDVSLLSAVCSIMKLTTAGSTIQLMSKLCCCSFCMLRVKRIKSVRTDLAQNLR